MGRKIFEQKKNKLFKCKTKDESFMLTYAYKQFDIHDM